MEDRSAHEEKKLKLRKAMADTTLVNEPRRKTKPSGDDTGVEDGDWTSLIDEQNQGTNSN